MTVLNQVAPGAYGVGLIVVIVAESPQSTDDIPIPLLMRQTLYAVGKCLLLMHTNLSQGWSCLCLTPNTYYKVPANSCHTVSSREWSAEEVWICSVMVNFHLSSHLFPSAGG